MFMPHQPPSDTTKLPPPHVSQHLT